MAKMRDIKVVVLSACAFLYGCHQSGGHTLDRYLLMRSWVANSPAMLVVVPVRASTRKLAFYSLQVRLPVGWRVLSQRKGKPGPSSCVLGIPHYATGGQPESKDVFRARIFAFTSDRPASMRTYARDLASVYTWRKYRGLGGVSRFFSKYRSPWELIRAVYRTDARLLDCPNDAMDRRLRCLLSLRVFTFTEIRFFWEGQRLRAAIKVFPRPAPWHYLVDAVLFNEKGQDCGYLALQSRSLRKRQAVFAVAEMLSAARFVRGTSPTSRPQRPSTPPRRTGISVNLNGRKGGIRRCRGRSQKRRVRIPTPPGVDKAMRGCPRIKALVLCSLIIEDFGCVISASSLTLAWDSGTLNERESGA